MIKKMMKWFPLSKPFLNFSLNSPKGYRTWIVERPGEWMNDEELQHLESSLQSVVDKLGIGGLNYGMLQGGREKMKQGIITLIYNRETNAPVAFNALTIMNC
ncbi:MAG: hypothetical protein V4736_00005, partial [Bdellovibrionota bacterium]